MDQDQHWLINCLNASLDPSQDVRTFAETSLQQASTQSGFGVALARVSGNRELSFGIRQLAGVLLKQYVKKHWNDEEELFEHPIVSSVEKASIRGILLSLLDDQSKKICIAVSVAVSTIAQYDWPDDWPDLLPCLLSLVNDKSKLHAVHGALRCLALITSDMDDKMVPKIMEVLSPSLLNIVSSPQIYDEYMRSKALLIVYNCISMLGVMSGVYKMEATSLMLPMLQPWMEQFSAILKHPVPSEDPDDWSIRMEVFKCLNQFLSNFSTIVDTQFAIIVGPLWQTFVSSLDVYERSMIDGAEDSYDGRYDSDGAERSLESFVIQMFEFLLTIVGSPKFVKAFMNNVKELVYYTIGFLKMTEQQVHTWSLDANQYVADEDENTYSCRVSGVLLLEEIISSCGLEGLNAIFDSIQRRIRESQQQKDAGSPCWWKLREAALFALASISEQLFQAEASKSSMGNMLEQILTDDIAIGVDDYPFLQARLLSCVAKFSSVMNHQVTEHFLHAAIKTLGMDVPPPVKVGACQALSELLSDSSREITEPHALDLFSSLLELLNNASDETMHLVLETLQAAAKAAHGILASIEPVISPIILNMWALHVSNPFISIDALEVLEAIKNASGCIHPLVSRVLPFIGPILSNPQQQPEGLVAGSLDLLTMLVKNAPGDVLKAVHKVSFDSAVRIILQSNDHSEMQNATQFLATLVSGGKQDLLDWGGDPGLSVRSLLDVASRLLDPSLESSSSLFAGIYILQLILHMPSQMAHHVRDLVIALTRRMQSSPTVGLKCSLLLIFARLVHISTPQVEQFIDLLVSIPVEGHRNSFAYVMFEWTKLQEEVQGVYQIKVTTSALVLLLLSGHAELRNIYVQGNLIKSNKGIITRSRAKQVPDQWTSVPLPVKILALLADALIEIQEQVNDDNEDSLWEDPNDKYFQISAQAALQGRPTYEYLESMAKAFEEDHDDDYEDEYLSSSDPLNDINLVRYLVEFFSKFSNQDRPYFEHLYQNLTKTQQKAIQMVLQG